MTIEIVELLDAKAGIRLAGANAFPTNPAELQIFGKTGTSAGLYIYKNGAWQSLDSPVVSNTGVVKQVVTGTISSYSGTTLLPVTTTPTITSGTQIWSDQITVTAGSRVLLKTQVFADCSVSNRYISLAFFRGTTLIGATAVAIASSGVIDGTSYMDYDEGMAAGTHTYSCRVGVSSNSTWYINQDKNGKKFGAGISNTYSLTEIQ